MKYDELAKLLDQVQADLGVNICCWQDWLQTFDPENDNDARLAETVMEAYLEYFISKLPCYKVLVICDGIRSFLTVRAPDAKRAMEDIVSFNDSNNIPASLVLVSEKQ